MNNISNITYLVNAFSLNMLEIEKNESVCLKVSEIDVVSARNMVNEAINIGTFVSGIGHEATANILKEILEVHVPYNRVQIKLKKGDKAIVAQIVGFRIEEGKIFSKEEIIELLNRQCIKFFIVTL